VVEGLIMKRLPEKGKENLVRKQRRWVVTETGIMKGLPWKEMKNQMRYPPLPTVGGAGRMTVVGHGKESFAETAKAPAKYIEQLKHVGHRPPGHVVGRFVSTIGRPFLSRPQ